MILFRVLGQLFFISMVLLGCKDASASGTHDMKSKAVSNLLELDIPYSRDGLMLTVWSKGADHPNNERMIVVSNKQGIVKIPLIGVSEAQWGSKKDILALQSLKGKSKIIRINRKGAVLESFGGDYGMNYLEPSHSGDMAALVKYDTKGNSSLEIRGLDPKFYKIAELDMSPLEDVSLSAWNDNDTSLAFGFWKVDNKGRMWPILSIATNNLKDIQYPLGETVEKQSEPGGVVPYFWFNGAIYGRSERGLLKCDPDSGETKLIYSPGNHRSIAAGVLTDSGKALLLVRDLQLDPLEARSKEIHEVNVANGGNRILLRAEGDMFIMSVDWIK